MQLVAPTSWPSAPLNTPALMGAGSAELPSVPAMQPLTPVTESKGTVTLAERLSQPSAGLPLAPVVTEAALVHWAFPPLTDSLTSPVSSSQTVMPPVVTLENAPETSNEKAGRSLLGGVASAAGLFLVGRLLHRLPAHHVTLPTRLSRWKWITDVVPTDWKDWARMFLGVGVVNHLNQGISGATGRDSKAIPPWGVALETVAVLTPMMSPKMLSKQAWKTFLPVAIAVPPLVQGTAWAKKKLEDLDASGQANIPKWVSHTALPVLSTVVGVFGLRKYMNWSNGASQTSTGNVVGAELVCVRCGGMHLVCPTEIAEFFGGLAGGLRHQNTRTKEEFPVPTVHAHRMDVPRFKEMG